MGATVGLCTLGCKVSQYETEAIAEELVRRGYIRRPFSDRCDVYVINTCTVTREADRKCRQMIRRAIRRSPDACVVVCGCYAQTTPEELAAIPGVRYISGTYGKMAIPDAIDALLGTPVAPPIVEVTDVDAAPFEPMRISGSPRTRVYVKIEDGCECRCTYCAIPLARGRVRSKPLADVLDEVASLSANGVEEVVLTGIETASWGKDLGLSLIDLLEALDAKRYVSRIRLGSLSPESITPAFVERLARLTTIAPHFHLSMQSGCDKTLHAMKRRYNVRQALAALTRLREAIPYVQFTTDMMVGFPGETEEDFATTLDFVKEARFLDMHVFAYSKRAGTPAATYPDQVGEDTKAERSRILSALGVEIRDTLLDEVVERGEPLTMIPETLEAGSWTGHSDAFLALSLPDSPAVQHGVPLRVTPSYHKDGVVYCEPTT